MWKCPRCERNFKITNQSHTCVVQDIGELFVGKPDELVLAFDAIVQKIEKWKPNTYGASKNAVVFTSKKAWLIIRPMKKELDIKFYSDEPVDSPQLHKSVDFNGKYACHIRIQNEDQVTDGLIELLRIGYDYSVK